MKQTIQAFELDDAQEWLAVLACGHSRHVRHRPPMFEAEWLASEAGRTGRVGTELECGFCEMPRLPESAAVYGEVGPFDQDSVPPGLLKDHRTKNGTWARIVVSEGRLRYIIERDQRPNGWSLRPGIHGIVAPEEPHHVELDGPVTFRLELLREA